MGYMRKILRPKIWSQGTNIGYLRALGTTPVVLGFVQMVFLFTLGMVYMIPHSNALDNFSAQKNLPG